MIRHQHDLQAPRIAVPSSRDYVDVLLDEWDTQISQCADALHSAAQARRELAMTLEPMAVIEAETLLAVAARTGAERRALARLALRRHEGWSGHREAARAAQERLHEAECRATVARMRAHLVSVALAAALGREHAQS